MFSTSFLRIQNKRYTYSNLRIVILFVISSVVLSFISCVNKDGNIAYNRAIEAQQNGHYQEACNYYQQAVNADPENSLKNHDVIYYNWGTALFYLAYINNNNDLYEASFEKYKKAIEINPNYFDAYNYWGLALFHLAKKENNKTLYEASIGKYKKAIELNPNSFYAYNNWGTALLELARLENNIEEYKNDIFEVLLKAEKFEEGSGAYNLACLHSLLDEKDAAFKYLKSALWMKKTPGRDWLEKHTDFDNLKSDPRFEELLNKYYPKDKN